ncbi:MAG TPA: SsrA-binding protein SmpB [Candidatus Binatia bacterium]|nr:SsrA-binding protein SmpB [Candidatus Binatia bacterium]
MAKPEKESDAAREIAINRRARFEYFIEDRYEAGLVLQGWEVKSLRQGRGQIADAYVKILRGEAWLIGAHFMPPAGVSTHVQPDPTRSRKLLLQAGELARLVGKVERAGYTLVPLDLHWTRGRAKIEIGLAKGKKQHDKREGIKARDWARQKSRLMRQG